MLYKQKKRGASVLDYFQQALLRIYLSAQMEDELDKKLSHWFTENDSLINHTETLQRWEAVAFICVTLDNWIFLDGLLCVPQNKIMWFIYNLHSPQESITVCGYTDKRHSVCRNMLTVGLPALSWPASVCFLSFPLLPHLLVFSMVAKWFQSRTL